MEKRKGWMDRARRSRGMRELVTFRPKKRNEASFELGTETSNMGLSLSLSLLSPVV